MAKNLITGFENDRTPHDHMYWGNPVRYNRVNYQNGGNLELIDYNNQNQ